MRIALKKRISLLYFFFLYFHTSLISHGFAAHTPIHLSNGSQKTIHFLCLHALHNSTYVTSYNIHNPCKTAHRINLTGQGETNCYIRLSFDNEYNTANDIICSPTQEFYVQLTNQWIPAYMLKLGDELLTNDMGLIPLLHKEFVPQRIKTYMIEIEHAHTFFVGRHGILTHNNFLPLAINLGFVVPFGSVATASAGGFFGPIGVLAGFAIGGIMGITIKAVCRNRILHYKVPIFNVSFIKNSCDNIAFSRENIPTIPKTCFSIQDSLDAPCVYPIENPLPGASAGCVEIEIVNSSIVNICKKYTNLEEINSDGCFQLSEQHKQSLLHLKEKTTELSHTKKDVQDNNQYNGPWYNRTEDWVNEHPFGQKIRKSLERSPYTNQGKRAFKVIENIENCDGFKKSDYVVIDALHKDHLEVFGKDRKWKSVANFNGTHNIEKTKQGKKEPRQPLR